MGELMIPAREVDRLVALAKPYDPKPRKPKLAEENGGASVNRRVTAKTRFGVCRRLDTASDCKNACYG